MRRALRSVVSLALSTWLMCSVAAADEIDEQVNYLPDDPYAAPPEIDEQVSFLPEEPDAPPPDPESKPIHWHFEATLGGVLAVPFAGEPGSPVFGFGMTYGVGLGALPFMLGVDFMSAGGGSDRSFSAAAESGENMEVYMEAKSRTLYFDAWLRVQPRDWPVRPYIEGFAGGRFTMVQYSLRNANSTDDMSSGGNDGWSTSMGYGAGVDLAGLLQIADHLSFTLGARRLHGTHTSFTLDGDVSGQRVATHHDNPGSVWLFMLGIVTWLDLGNPS